MQSVKCTDCGHLSCLISANLWAHSIALSNQILITIADIRSLIMKSMDGRGYYHDDDDDDVMNKKKKMKMKMIILLARQ